MKSIYSNDYNKTFTNKSNLGSSGGVMVSMLDEQTFSGEFESHWVPHSYGFVPHLT